MGFMVVQYVSYLFEAKVEFVKVTASPGVVAPINTWLPVAIAIEEGSSIAPSVRLGKVQLCPKITNPVFYGSCRCADPFLSFSG